MQLKQVYVLLYSKIEYRLQLLLQPINISSKTHQVVRVLSDLKRNHKTKFEDSQENAGKGRFILGEAEGGKTRLSNVMENYNL